MITLEDFFVLNREIIFFIYGLVFFLLGGAIILQTRRSSRLDLARSLRWLAAFGITHGFYEWGDLFLPIQSEYLGAAVMRVLYFAHGLLLPVSFVCLFEFGITVQPSSRKVRGLHPSSVFVFVLWALAISLAFVFGYADPRQHVASNALARYLIGLPGGLLAAYGLRAHALERIQPLNVPQIVNMLRIAGISLGIYAFFGGFIVPPVPFFPGNIINTATFTDWVGVPPLVFRSMVGMLIAFTIIRALEVFDLETERRIEELEQQQIINAEHERLARDLHDGAIQKVYTAGLLVESAVRLAETESELEKRLKRAMAALNDSIADLRRNLSDLHAHTQTAYASLPDMLAAIANNPNYNTMVGITTQIQLPPEKALTLIRAGHVAAMVNEAMSNIVRHAHALNVSIRAVDLGDMLQIQIKDDGMGMPEEIRNGYGLRNMRDRARLLNGTIRFENQKGLLVTLEIPWKD